MRNMLNIGGFIAAAVLIAFGIGAIVMGVNGRHTVQTAWRRSTSSVRPT